MIKWIIVLFAENMCQKVRWFVNHVGLRSWEGVSMEELIVDSIEELEELYTRHMITYSQYINIKKRLEEREEKNE